VDRVNAVVIFYERIGVARGYLKSAADENSPDQKTRSILECLEPVAD
jgi:hypothetical protein